MKALRHFAHCLFWIWHVKFGVWDITHPRCGGVCQRAQGFHALGVACGIGSEKGFEGAEECRDVGGVLGYLTWHGSAEEGVEGVEGQRWSVLDGAAQRGGDREVVREGAELGSGGRGAFGPLI